MKKRNGEGKRNLSFGKLEKIINQGLYLRKVIKRYFEMEDLMGKEVNKEKYMQVISKKKLRMDFSTIQ